MTTSLLVADAPTAAESAFARLFSLAAWVSHQAEDFTFADAANALRDAYGGSGAAADRRWSRDKLALDALGLSLTFDGAAYAYQRVSRCRWFTGSRSALLAATVRDVPAGDDVLEMALRKLLAHGAPILGALMTRADRNGAPRARESVTRTLSLASMLVMMLQAAGKDGLSVGEAVVATGARDAKELERVVHLLLRVKLPFEAPDDAVPLLLDEGRVALYSLVRLLPLPGFTAEEHQALERAGLTPVVPATASAAVRGGALPARGCQVAGPEAAASSTAT